MAGLNEAQKDQARRLWEGGMTFSAIARQYGTSAATISNYAKQGGWLRTPAEPETPVPVAEPEPQEDPKVAELEAQLAEEKEARLEAEEEAAAYKPFVELNLFNTPEEFIEYMGPERLQAIAERNVAIVNKKRIQQGLPGLDRDDPKEYMRLIEDQVRQEAAEAVSNRTRHAISEGQGMRMVKLFNPKADTLLQVPLEDQVNNKKGSLNDALERYYQKGFKRTSPLLCLLKDCWLESAVEGTRLIYAGYCSEEHRMLVPAEQTDPSGRNLAGMRVNA